jgi:type I restriction enzyme S subunit
LFLELFGDPATNPKRWPAVRLEQVFSAEKAGTRCGPFGTALTKADYVATGVPVWGIENVLPNRFRETGYLFITTDKFAELKAYSVEAGDLLISRAGTVGRVCVARPSQLPSIIGTNLIRVSLNTDRVVPEYLSALLSYFADRIGDLRASSDEDAYSFMKTGVLARLRVPVPDYKVQQRYLAALTKAEECQEMQQRSQDELDSMLNCLLQRAFRGEL